MSKLKQQRCEQEVDSPRATPRAERVVSRQGAVGSSKSAMRQNTADCQLLNTYSYSYLARRSSRAIGIASAFVLALLVAPLRAELVVVEEDIANEGNLTTYKMTVSPAAEPVPALKERLVSRELDLQDGNAAPYYYRALMGVTDIAKALHKEYGDAYWDWYSGDTPLDELPLEKVREAAERWKRMEENLRVATRRRRCDWEWNIEDMRGMESVTFVIDEIQNSRELCRALGLSTRLALVDRDYQRAIDLLRINYRLGHDSAEAPFLVSDLVGMAITGIGHHRLIELIAQPDSPNLYWAIAELPSPPIDIRESMRSEMSIGQRVFPFILDAETAEHSPEEWSRLMAEAIIQSQSTLGTGSLDKIPLTQARLAVAGMSMVAYPSAKQRLIQGGMKAEQVEKMPVGQVVAIDALHEYRRVADSIEKWLYVPYREARKRDVEKELHISAPQSLAYGYGHTIARLLLPAVQYAWQAEQRLVWQTGGIQTVEAIRMHAAETGKLPASLEEIKIVPLPRNPVTDKPYQYKLEGDTAVLELPFSDGFSNIAERFEITLEKSP